jgi:hypothetical protein
MFRSISFLLLTWFFLTNASKDPNNPPTGRTGAPGETTCAQSSCHNGGTYTGTVALTGIPDTVIAGQTYTLTLTNTSNAVKAGFQMTCWDANNVMSGTFTAPNGSGVNIGSGAGTKRYARQSSPKTLSGGSAAWTYTWKAPTTAAGNKATFYYVSLCANGTGNQNGDNVLQASKSVVLKAASANQDVLAPSAYAFYPTLVTNGSLFVELREADQGQLVVYNTQGKIVKKQVLTAFNQLDVSHLSSGAYTVQIQVDDKTAWQKFIVE